MICPQKKAEMTCPHIEGCFLVGCNHDCEAPEPPPPTLAEIERLVDAFGAKMEAYGDFRVDKECWDDYEPEREALRTARAALLAAIQRHIQE